MPRLLPLGLLASSVLLSPLAAQSTWYVDATASGPGTGTSFDPYPAIQIAIDAASTVSGDTVVVRPGIYSEALDLAGKSLELRAIGGPDVTVVDAGGAARVVSVVSGEGAGTAVRRFTLRGGRASIGGGVLVDGAELELTDCRVESNVSQSDGGGLAATNGARVVARDCTFLGNAARGSGGGVRGPAVLIDSFLTANTALRGGGASHATLTNCGVNTNRAHREGGGLAECRVEGGWVSGNRARSDDALGFVRGGGVLACDCTGTTIGSNTAYGEEVEGVGAADSRLVRCTIRGHQIWKTPVRGVGAFDCELDECLIESNFATDHQAAGIGMYGGVARDCVIRANSAPVFIPGAGPGPAFGTVGGGAAAARLERCEISGNAARHGGGVFSCQATLCTIWGGGTESLVVGAFHVPSGSPGHTTLDSCVVGRAFGYGVSVLAGSSVDAQWSLVQGGWPGVGNLDTDPLFVQGSFGDLRLLPGSPCIDAGNPQLPPDPDGSRADIGARPFEPNPCGGPWERICGNWYSESEGRASASGTSALTITSYSLRPGAVGVPLIAFDSGERPAGSLGTICVAGPLARGVATPVGADGTFVWSSTPAELSAAGATAGDRIFVQIYLPTGGSYASEPRLTRLVETLICP